MKGLFFGIYEVLLSNVLDFDVYPCIVLQEFQIKDEPERSAEDTKSGILGWGKKNRLV